MASKKRQAYYEGDTKAIMSESGMTITLEQLDSLEGGAYPYHKQIDDVIQQLKSIMTTESVDDAHITIDSSKQHLRLLHEGTHKAGLCISRAQSAALHDLFQGSRVEKIRQKHMLQQ